MQTFAVSEVEMGSRRLQPSSLADSLTRRIVEPIEASMSNLDDLVDSSNNAFISAVHQAFSEHLPLVLSPDDVWLCITQGFAGHVNLNAEALRTRLVEHSGKIEIEVTRPEFVKGGSGSDWLGVFDEFSNKLATHLGKKRDLVVADFSTTGRVERAASQLILMNTFQAYFSYEFSSCGIPRITLLGTVADWKMIRRRAEFLGEYGLSGWVAALLPVLDQFIAAASGSADAEFWRSFYKFNGRSGGPYVSGWINALFPYLGNGTPEANPYVSSWQNRTKTAPIGPSTSDFPNGLCRAPFKWRNGSVTTDAAFAAGFVGVSQDPKTRSVRPAIGWAVTETLPPPRSAALPR